MRKPFGLGLGINDLLRGSTAPPVNVSAPVVTGTGYVGYTLSTTNGTWTNSPTSYAYQWTRNGSNIVGATNSTYLVTLSDEGETIRCKVTAISVSGSSVPELSNAIEQWVPTDAGAAPTHWYDAFDASTLTVVGSSVTNWANKGSLGSSLAQTTAVNQPNYDTTGLDGYPAVVFNGNDVLLRTTSDGTGRNVSGLLMAAMAIPTTLSNRTLLSITTAITSENRAILRLVDNTFTTGGRRIDGESFQSTNVGTIVVSTKNSFIGCLNYGEAEVFGLLNGVASTPETFHIAGNTSDTNSAQRRVGSNINIEYFIGPISETIQYNILPNAANQAKLAGYLAWRSRAVPELDAGSPYKTIPPTP